MEHYETIMQSEAEGMKSNSFNEKVNGCSMKVQITVSLFAGVLLLKDSDYRRVSSVNYIRFCKPELYFIIP